MNKHSSRSHCIFTITVEATRRVADGSILESSGKLHMVDLAGSECAKTAGIDHRIPVSFISYVILTLFVMEYMDSSPGLMVHLRHSKSF